MAYQQQATPKTIWLYLIFAFLGMIYSAVVPGQPAFALGASAAIAIFLRLLFLFLLVNRSWFGFVLAAIYEASLIIVIPLTSAPTEGYKPWGLIFIHTTALALILTRATRQHVFSHKEAPPVRGSGPSAPQSDSTIEPADNNDVVEPASDESRERRNSDATA